MDRIANYLLMILNTGEYTRFLLCLLVEAAASKSWVSCPPRARSEGH